MESKTKHRLLGVLVVAGLAVIAWPFLQGHESTTEVTTIREPAFPGQAVQLSPSAEEQQQVQSVAEIDNNNTPPSSASIVAPPSPPVPPSPASPPSVAPERDAPLGAEEMKNEPDDIIKTEHPVEPTKSAPAIPAPGDENKAPSSNTSTDEDATPPKKTSSEKKSKQTTVSKVTKHASKKTLANKSKNSNLFNIQDASWVIQVGSFKNKTAALKVVNQLRASGYHAFIQQFASNDDGTRVFIGPENKQAHARQLAQELNAKMHLQGIVISYEPLEA